MVEKFRGVGSERPNYCYLSGSTKDQGINPGLCKGAQMIIASLATASPLLLSHLSLLLKKYFGPGLVEKKRRRKGSC